jgi:hypothetical protein
MNRNIGNTDKYIRLAVAFILAILAFFLTSEIARVVVGFFALMLFFTAFTNYCLLYTLLGINTCKVKK